MALLLDALPNDGNMVGKYMLKFFVTLGGAVVIIHGRHASGAEQGGQFWNGARLGARASVRELQCPAAEQGRLRIKTGRRTSGAQKETVVVESERKYQLGFALIESSGLDLFSDTVLDQFRNYWRPGATVTRYRRNWRLTRVLHETDDLLFGEIGFVNQGTVGTLDFDPAKQEFVPGDASGGYRVPFCVRKSDLVIAYQLYPGVVRPNTFTAAMEAFWNLAADGSAWSVSSLGKEMAYEEWRAEQEVIERMDVRVVRPNPHYFDNDRIESLIEDTESEYVRLVADAQEGRSLDLDYPLFREAIDHVLRDYGKAKLSGRDRSDELSVWVKVRNRVAQVISSISVAMSGEREAPQEAFIEAFSRLGPATPSDRLSYDEEQEE